MNCPVCGNPPEARHCRECLNDSEHPVDLSLDAVGALRRGFAACRSSHQDYGTATREFREATALAATLPPLMGMMAWFTYAMYVCKGGGGPSLKGMSEESLPEYTQALEKVSLLFQQLPAATRAEYSAVAEFQQMLSFLLNGARRSMSERGLKAFSSPAQSSPPRVQPVQPRVGEANGDNYTFAHPYGAERLEVASTGIRCVKCPNHVIPLSPCSNCGGRTFLLGTDVLRLTALVCFSCRNGFASVKCVCGCQNPIGADTIMRLKVKSGGCFIATAACGDHLAPDVMALSAFRDEVLLQRRMGRAFVRCYSLLSKLTG